MFGTEFYGGFAMGILMDGVMGCRTYDGLMQVFCRLYTGVMMVLCGFGFPEPPALPAQPSCESQASADAPD